MKIPIKAKCNNCKKQTSFDYILAEITEQNALQRGEFDYSCPFCKQRVFCSYELLISMVVDVKNCSKKEQ